MARRNPFRNMRPASIREQLRRNNARFDQEDQMAWQNAHIASDLRVLRSHYEELTAEQRAEAIREQRNSPEGKRKRAEEVRAETLKAADAEKQHQTVQERWAAHREVAQAQLERQRADMIASGRISDMSLLPKDLPVLAPAEWGTADTGVPRIHKPDQPPTEKNPDGTRTLKFDVSPLSGQKLNAAAPPKTPEEIFKENG